MMMIAKSVTNLCPEKCNKQCSVYWNYPITIDYFGERFLARMGRLSLSAQTTLLVWCG